MIGLTRKAVSEVEVAVLTFPTALYLILLDASTHLPAIALLLGYNEFENTP
jgi:hypothetical protein